MAAVVPLLPPITDLPEAVQVLRTERERAFVWHYMFNGGNGAAAARKAGYSDVKDGAKVRAHGLLQRNDIQAALSELVQRYMFSLAPVAMLRLGQLLRSKDEKIAAKAVAMALPRVGLPERTALDVNVQGNVTVDHTQAAADDLARMIELGVPEEKLIEAFGFSGLSRYRRLLADRAKQVEAKVE